MAVRGLHILMSRELFSDIVFRDRHFSYPSMYFDNRPSKYFETPQGCGQMTLENTPFDSLTSTNEPFTIEPCSARVSEIRYSPSSPLRTVRRSRPCLDSAVCRLEFHHSE